jgi:RNA polymerase sigma factor (sigma-70 family)
MAVGGMPPMNPEDSSNAVGKGPTDDPRLAGVWDHFYDYCFTIINECPGVRRLSSADREDCVQDVMMEIVRKFGTPRTGSLHDKLTGWIRVISRNKAADIVRRKFRKPEVFFDDGAGAAVLDAEPPSDVDSGVSHGEYVSLVWEALISLDQHVSATSYLVFYLRSIEGWSIREIAELFQISADQAKARCHRVKKKFGSILESNGRQRGRARPS